jgi:predicted aspartyl protease
MSLAIDVEIESTDTAVRQCTQALIDCGATGCFINVEWAQSNNVPTCPLTNPIPVYNVDGTANEAGMIVEIADMILCYDGHSKRTQFVVTHLGKQSMILGYNWLRNHNPEINWQTKDVKMSRCPTNAQPATLKPNVRPLLTKQQYRGSMHAELEPSPP